MTVLRYIFKLQMAIRKQQNLCRRRCSFKLRYKGRYHSTDVGCISEQNRGRSLPQRKWCCSQISTTTILENTFRLSYYIAGIINFFYLFLFLLSWPIKCKISIHISADCNSLVSTKAFVERGADLNSTEKYCHSVLSLDAYSRTIKNIGLKRRLPVEPACLWPACL